MIKTIDMLLHEYRDYSNIYNKIAYEEKNKNLEKPCAIGIFVIIYICINI